MAALKAISSIVAMQIFGAGATLAVVLVLTAALGPEGYGRYVWVVSMGGVAALLLQRGLPTTLVKTYAPLDLDTLSPPPVISNTLSLYALMAGAAVLSALIILPMLQAFDWGRPEIVWAVPIAAGLACLAISDAILRSAEKGTKAQFASQIIRTGLLLLACVTGYVLGQTHPQMYLLIYASSALLAALVFTWPLIVNASREGRGAGLVTSSPAHFHVSLSRSIGNHLPVFITGFFVSPEALSYLALAIRLTGPVLFGITASRAYFGARINRHIKGQAFLEAQRDYGLSQRFSIAVGIAAAITVLGVFFVLLQIPSGPLASFHNTELLLSCLILALAFRLSLASVGPIQLIALLLGADNFVRRLNLTMLCLLTLGLIYAGVLGHIWLSATILVFYGASLGGGLYWKVRALFGQMT